MFIAISDGQLKTLAKRMRIKLIDVVSKDTLAKRTPRDGSYIINLQDSDAGNGTHWVCCFIRGKRAMYYDSFGKVMPNDVLTFLKKKCNHIVYSVDQIQNLRSDACGYYCLAVLHWFTKYSKAKDLGYGINKYNQQYNTEDTADNEQILNEYFVKNKIYIDLL